MSNALAVAHVTQALALLIESNLRPEIDMAVSVETRKPPAEPPTEPTITVFLYQVTHNPSMRNYDLPTRASDGTLLNKAVAALDLHYVISAYGEENELVGQRLIGCVARIMREFPVLPADVIEEAGERPYLAGSDLAEAEQKVRFTPQQMDVDETSKLWGMLHQTPYSLSMTYQASLVLIEGREKPERSRPVRRTEVTVGASHRAHGRGDSPAGNGGSPAGTAAAAPFAGAPGVSVGHGGGGGGSQNGEGAGGPVGRSPDGVAGAAGTAGERAARDAGAARQSVSSARQPGAGKPAARKSTARQSAGAAAKRTASRGAKKAAEKTAAKKTAAKKTAEKTAAKKSAAKKSAAKKSAVKKAAGNAPRDTSPGRPENGTSDGGES